VFIGLVVALGPCLLPDLLVAPAYAAGPNTDRFLGANVPWHEPRDRRVGVTDLDLAVKIDPSTKTVEGTAILTVEVSKPGGKLELHAADLDIRSAEWIAQKKVTAAAGAAEKTQPVAVAVNNQRISLKPPTDKKGDVFRLKIVYRARPKLGVYFVAPIPGDKDRPLHIFTQGEPIEARHWMPCPDNPDARLTWTVRATLPAKMNVLSNGTKLNESKRGRWKTTTYRMGLPHPIYLLTLVAGPFTEVVHRKGRVKLSSWAFARDRSRVKYNSRNLPDMLDFFEKITRTSYPFIRYGQVFVHEFGGGGMENVTLTSLTSRAMGNKHTDHDWTIDGLLAHELAHQWFGDLVTCRTWADIWLNESFATYYQKLYTRHHFGAARFAEEMDGARRSSTGLDKDRYLRPIVSDRYAHPVDVFDANSYPKGAWVLHMIANKIGEKAFLDAVGKYLKRHRFGSVETEDLRRAFEAESGISLRGFFQRWVRQAGHPRIRARIRYRNRKVVLKFEQTQRVTRQMPLYRLPIEVAIRRRKDSAVAQVHTVMLSGKRATLTIPAKQRPEVIEIDPKMKLYAKWRLDAGPDVLANIARWGRHPDVRLRAVRALRRGGLRSQRAVATLIDVLRNDKARHVRGAAAQILGRGTRAEVRDALLVAMRKDKQAPVRQKAATALGQLHDARSWQALVMAATQERSHAVQQAALRALVNIDSKRARDVMLQALKIPSERDRVKTTALQGLGKIGDPRDIETLLAAIGSDQRLHLRKGAVYAVAAMAVRTDNRAVRDRLRGALEALLNDPNRRLRAAAANAVGAIGDPASRGALLAVVAREPHARWAFRMKLNLRKLGKNMSANRRLKKIEEKLQRMERERRHEHKK